MRVLISGAGIAGPTLAYFLSRTGAQISIVEKAANFLDQGQNIDINGSATIIAKKMGILDEVRRLNTTEKGTQFVYDNGKPFAVFPIAENHPSMTSELEILRGDLAGVIYRATLSKKGIDYRFGTTVTEVLSNDDRSVRVSLSNGAIEEYDLLVAADGQWSRIRRQCFPCDLVNVRDLNMYASYFTLPRQTDDTDMWSLYHAVDSRIISTRPDPYGSMRTCISCMPNSAADKEAWQKASRSGREAQQDHLRKVFGGAGWETERILNAMPTAPDFYFQAIQQIKLSKWSQGRVLCLGDAAYAPTPLTGAGASLAMIGAYAVAGELSKVSTGSDSGSPPMEALTAALIAYESAFRPFVEETQEIPRMVPGILHPNSAWKRSVMRGTIYLGSKIAPFFSGPAQADDAKEDFVLEKYECFQDEAFSEKATS